MSVSKFTPAELEELRRADAEIDAEDTPLEYELDAELDAIAIAQASGKPAEQVIAKREKDRGYYLEHREERIAYTRKYYAEHKEQRCAKRHQYYLDHKAEYQARSRKYANAEKSKRHYQKQKEKEETPSGNA